METQGSQSNVKTEKLESNSVPFPDDYYLIITPHLKQAIYTFFNPDNKKISEYTGVEPLKLTELTIVGREIKKHLNPENRLSGDAVSKDFEYVKINLQSKYDSAILEEENKKELAELKNQEYIQERIKEAKIVLESKDMPLLYIASLVSWLTAGERNNIMLTFIAYASQVILKNPISVIGLGEGGSGKTHIQEVSMSLIPPQFIKHEKSITEAAMFNRAKEDPHYYDGCIVNYGDLGGRNSQDFIMEAKNLLKELQSDGFLNKPLNVPTPEGWEVKDIMLKGKPCLTYTTVPGFVFDDQELSRSIFITPRMDNKAVFNARKQIIELKHGKTYHLLQKYKKDIEITQYMVYLLREHMENITIINPYTDSVIKFLGESEYFKRDFDKYNGILKTITAFHSFNRPTFELGNKTVLFTSLRDIQLFISLLKPYHESISVNISPKAAEVLEIIRDNWADWLLEKKIGEMGLTTNEYFELVEPNISKRSVRRYFGELNNAGFLKIVDGVGRGKPNVYAVTGKFPEDKLRNLLELDDKQKELIRWELGEAALQFIEMDSKMDGLSIELQDPDVDRPGWDYYDR